jgi:site-specific DNA-methyltransferase (adenine-specific)
MRNTLYYGDNLAILREHIPSESVDLVYLDPPFNSNRSYNVLFKHEGGREAEAQVQAFGDTWHWNHHTEAAYRELTTRSRPEVGAMIAAMHEFIGENQMMAYLVMMAARLAELHRVLKPTGSLYLHCDPTASHYLKVVLDTIFGPDCFINEIVWQRTATKGDARRKWGAVHDLLLVYSRQQDENVFNPQFADQDDSYRGRFVYDDNDGRGRYRLAPLDSPNTRPNLTYTYKGYQPPAKGWRVSKEIMEQLDSENRLVFPKHAEGRIARKHYLNEQKGRKVADVWTDIPPLQASAGERLGYPTQKPVALLERIISASSNPGDIVLDPFCGCGTTVAAAHKLGRTWLGIDITHLAIALQKYRLKAAFGLVDRKDYDVVGEPVDLAGAQQLASEDRYQFQWWALSLIQAQPLGGDGESKRGKKGADGGIDGVIAFIDDASGKPKRVIVQVKSGHVTAATVRDLRGVVEREKAAIGVLITLEQPTAPMTTEAARAGVYQSFHWGEFPRLQILTVEHLLSGRQRLQMPPQGQTSVTFKQAQREEEAKPAQPGLGLK